MKPERTVIAEGRLSSLVVLTCVPVILMLAMTVALLTGWSRPDDGMYYRAYGSVVLAIFYGGGLYATYEFTSTVFERKKYISTDGDSIYVPYHRPIEIAAVSDIYFDKGLLSDSLVILQRGGRKTRVRTHFLRDDADLVLQRLTKLAGTPDR